MKKLLIFYTFLLFLFASCSITYQFNGASINYDEVKTISVHDFPNQATLVYPELSQMFSQRLRERYMNQTRLKLLNQNGDLDLEGEITGYEVAPMAVKEDGYASQTKLTVFVRVRYSNRVKPDEDFEQTFSAHKEFDSSRLLSDVERELCVEIIDEITDMIFNATVANW